MEHGRVEGAAVVGVRVAVRVVVEIDTVGDQVGVGVGIVIDDRPVAIAVAAVAEFGSLRMKRRVRRRTVPLNRALTGVAAVAVGIDHRQLRAEAVPIGVLVAGDRVGPAAVLIHPVVGSLDRPGMHRFILIRTVLRVRRAVGVCVWATGGLVRAVRVRTVGGFVGIVVRSVGAVLRSGVGDAGGEP